MKHSTSTFNYTGIGPIVIPPRFTVANQAEVIEQAIRTVNAALSAATVADSLEVNSAPHHVISLIGGRGAGKTSVLLTLIRRLRREQPDLLVLDPLQPDQLREHLPLVPSIVALAERALHQLGSDSADSFITTESLPLRRLAWLNSGEQVIPAITRDTINLRDWNARLFEFIGEPTDLPGHFHTWIERLQECLQRRLVVVSIDDADISVDKAAEVIDTIRVFLAHPKILTVVATDLDGLERRIRNKRLAALPRVPELKSAEADDKSPTYLFGLSPSQYQSAEALDESEYVKNLLAKVLPPATRLYLRKTPVSERFDLTFFLPGNEQGRSLYKTLHEFETRNLRGDFTLVQLLERHQALFSGNLRNYTNQYVLINSYVAQTNRARSGDLKAAFEENRLKMSRTKHSPRLVDTTWLSISTPDDYLRSKSHMDIIRCLLATDECASVEEAFRKHVDYDLRQSETLVEMTHVILNEVVHVGTRYETGGGKNMYRIFKSNIHDPPSTTLIDLAIDYAILRGASVESVADIVDVGFTSTVTAFARIPEGVTSALDFKKLKILDPNITCIPTTIGAAPGGQIGILTDFDRAMPVFIKKSTDIGVFLHRILFAATRKRLDELSRETNEMLAKAKGAHAKREGIIHAVNRALGIIAVHALGLINGAVKTLWSEPGAPADSLSVQWGPQVPWLINKVSGVSAAIAQVVSDQNLTLSDRLCFLSFICDLPMGLIFTMAGPSTDRELNVLRTSLATFCDELQKHRYLAKRRSGQLALGAFVRRGPTKIPVIMQEMIARFPSVSVARREGALRRFIEYVNQLKVMEKSDLLVEPPPSWKGLLKKRSR
jgi:hypothetical protein